jgi:ThiF family
MTYFPESAEEFYALRDDRTNQCSGVDRVYQRVPSVVCLSPDAACTTSGQVMFAAATNLMSRWCRDVTLILPRVDILPILELGAGDLGEIVLSQMHDADPFGSFQITQNPKSSLNALLIGDDAYKLTAPTKVFISASGWLAGFSYRQPIELPDTTDENYLGAVAAACLGVAQIFKVATGASTDRWFRQGVFDLFGMKWADDEELTSAPWPSDLNVGKILMVGAGSVGSAAAYCMRLAQFAGRLTVLDKDDVKVENFNRSPIFGRQTFGLPKVEAIVQFLKGSRLSADPVESWWNDFVQAHNRESFDFDIWLPLANEFGVRSAMQHNVPPLMIHASTSSNWAVNHGRHVPGRDDCLIDRFRAQVAADDLGCATGQVVVQGVSIDAALPFSSMFAGVLVASDIARAQLPEYPHVPNFAFLDWHGAFEIIQSWDKKPQIGCICTEQKRAFHERFNRGTKYWPLFQLE